MLDLNERYNKPNTRSDDTKYLGSKEKIEIYLRRQMKCIHVLIQKSMHVHARFGLDLFAHQCYCFLRC